MACHGSDIRPGDHIDDMQIVHVHIEVKAGFEDAFIAASLENARNSVREPGIARFDVIRETADRSKFVLVEVYRDADAAVRHKETRHYAIWRDTVAEMMAVPRIGVKYENLYPADGGW
jgi:(4S)-4-hydroxy-5-phosphonooxypentane-2,3-dione isomerase